MIQAGEWTSVADELLLKGIAFKLGVKAGFDTVSESLTQKFKDEQFSGRGADNMGLNIITGETRASLKSLVEDDDFGLNAEIYNMTEDAHDVTDRNGFGIVSFHQFGMGNNPKRLTLEEDFETYGIEQFEGVIERSLEEMAA